MGRCLLLWSQTPVLCPNLYLSPWMALPGYVDTPCYVIGDIHGRLHALETALDTFDRSHTLITLGDVVDYGPNSIACLHTLAQAGFAQYIALPGNHEIMLAQALQDPENALPLWEMNGGHSVLKELSLTDAPIDTTLATLHQALPPSFHRTLLDTPSHHRNGTCLMVHAGISPHLPLYRFLAQKPDAPVSMECHWAWIRDPFLSWDQGWPDNTLVLHGHSPAITTPFQGGHHLEAFCQLHKGRINLDAGADRLDQIAWAHLHKGYFQLGIAWMTPEDIF